MILFSDSQQTLQGLEQDKDDAAIKMQEVGLYYYF